MDNGIDPSGKVPSQPKRGGNPHPTENAKESILVEGDGVFANKTHCQISNACGGLNALCVSYAVVSGIEVVVCGGVDKILRMYDMSNPESPREFFQHSYSAPVLSVQCHSGNGLAACALMDRGFIDLVVVLLTLLFLWWLWRML
jgi:hypothetical protein